MIMSWLWVVVLLGRSTPSGSTRLLRWWKPGLRWLVRLVSWPSDLGFPSAKHAGMSSVLPPAGPVELPAPTTVFTVKVPVALVARVRAHAAGSGRTISSVVTQALEEFLHRDRRGRPGS
jgi:hypothetical protein